MRRLAAILALGLVVVLALALGLVAAYGAGSGLTRTVSPKQLSDAGWFCLDPGYWVHCTPPGIDISKKPPVIVSLNFWTKDPKSAQARYLGFEDLIRVDIWKKTRRHWPCGSGAYRRVPGNSLPKPGYMYCHHFNDKIALPTR